MNGKLVATAVAASLALAGPAFAEPPQDRLQGLLDSFRQDYGFPGATAAMALADGSVVMAAIHADTSRGQVYGHGGWIPGYVSSLRHYADHGVTVAFQINTDVGIVDDSSDLVPALEAALAVLAIGQGSGAGHAPGRTDGPRRSTCCQQAPYSSRSVTLILEWLAAR